MQNRNCILLIFAVACLAYCVSIPIPETPSCKSYGCGGFDATHACQCNSACKSHGDCCSDAEFCFETCKSFGCNTFNSTRACQCNSGCTSHQDCCRDYNATCTAPPAPKPQPAVGCIEAPATPEDRRTDKSRLRITTYNVDFLFLRNGTSQLVCPGDGCEWKNETIALSHVDHVADEIRKIDADIISLNEVQDCLVLEALIARMPESNYKPYLIPGKDSFTGQNSGILTRIDPIENLVRTEAKASYPVPNSSCPSSKVSTGSSGNSKHYRARFNVDGLKTPLTIVATHLIAQPDDIPRCYQREAQATVLANEFISKAKDAGDSIIVWGDMNEFDDSVKDSYGNVPISSSLKIMREAGNLTNAASLISDVSERYTDWYDRDHNCVDEGDNEHSMIDHVLLSEGLLSKVSQVHIDHAYKQTCSCIYSDHWPVIIDLKL